MSDGPALGPVPAVGRPCPAASRTLRALDNAHVWHPFTAMSAYVVEEAPVIERGEGFYLIDVDGQRYLDGHSSLWCNIHGHRVGEIDAAIRDQLSRVAHSTLLGLSNVPSIELAAELVRRAPPGLSKVFYADCGAAGVEVALKLAWQYHRQKPRPEPRDVFACLGAAYHGDTVGTISLGGIDRFHSLFAGLMFPALRLPTPATPGLSLVDCLRQTEELLTAHAERIAAVVVEPLVQAAAGVLVHPPGYLRALRELTQRLGLLLIADEIAVGFGRLGSLLACTQEQVIPDLLVLSKGLTGGYLPLAATLTTEDVYAAFLGPPWEGRTFYHGHTYTGNPLACAAALASLRLIESNRVLDNARQIEQVLSDELVHPLRRDGCGDVRPDPEAGGEATETTTGAVTGQRGRWRGGLADVRHKGTMVGIELAPAPPEWCGGQRLTIACRKRGVIVRNIGDVLVLMPAPAMPAELVRHLCRVVLDALDEVLAIRP
uniref:Adenosylmethionine-8-amino-7-oxononanoate aminotransferase n=1 Tax=Schlesneria paludicola TaxID=360056 RepID=A0A7C4LMR7_9PLAN